MQALRSVSLFMIFVSVMVVAEERESLFQPGTNEQTFRSNDEHCISDNAAPGQQHQHPSMDQMNNMQMQMPGMASEQNDPIITHAHISSGTAWQPLSAPMHMWSHQAAEWLLMAHGNLFLTYNQQGGRHGVGKLESSNWLMLMEQHRLGPGTIQFRQMLSAEPLTFPHGGSPELFQTGETYKRIPLVDRQHPHDVFGELSALYSLPISEHVHWEFYGGPAGEPAFGPVTYLHRLSASELPETPLGHHLQDSTHIAYGVVTTGVAVTAAKTRAIKLEVSAFNGREPDEDRVDLDFEPLDSFSGRITFDPARNWSMQYSYAHLVHPEASDPSDINRQTASIGYDRPLPKLRGNFASTFVWGRNHKALTGVALNSYLLEGVLSFKKKNYAFSRLELVDKDELFANMPAPPSPALQRSFRIGSYTLGGVRDLVQNNIFQMGLGADISVYSKSVLLNPIYGRSPVSFRVFLRFRPAESHHTM